MTAPWEAYLRENLVGYLLPAAYREAVDVEVAQRFLARLSGRPWQLRLLREVSFVSAYRETIEDFCIRSLPALATNLPSKSHVEKRHWDGAFQGRLDIRATMAQHLAGHRTRFVTSSSRRAFDRPENLLIREVAENVLNVVGGVKDSGAMGKRRWEGRLSDAAGRVRHTLATTALRHVPLVECGSFHVQAALGARHRAYEQAVVLQEALCTAFRDSRPRSIAKLVADGALCATKDHRRFELAVAVRFIKEAEVLLEAWEPGHWTLERSLVLRKRNAVARFKSTSGAKISVHFDRRVLPRGPHSRGVRHYFGTDSAIRPDLTLVVKRPGSRKWAVVVEAKHSSDKAYQRQGFAEARAYAAEYAKHLRGWPQAILVVSQGEIVGPPRPKDNVIAVNWTNWPPPAVVASVFGVDLRGTESGRL